MDKKKVLSPEEAAYQGALEQEADLARLQRRYDLMERDRRLQTENRSVKLVRQEKVLRIYQKEYNNIEKDLKVATAPMRKKEDQKNMVMLMNVLENYDEYDAKIKRLQGFLVELDGQIYMKKHEILDLETKQISDHQMHDKVVQARITLEKLENKLELHMKKFCEICYENKRLREVINTLMHDRRNFNILWKKLITRLNMGKRFMLDIIEQATLAYDEREEWVSKLKLLTTRNKMIFAKNVQEMRELERSHDNMAKLKHFLLYKGTRRKMIDLEYKTSIKRKMVLANIQLKLDNYKKLIAEVFEFCNEDKVDIIGKTFVRQENSNFSMFQHLIDINKDIEALNESLYDLYDKIMDKKGGLEIMSIQQMEKLEELASQLEVENEKHAQIQKINNSINTNLLDIFAGIENLFKLLNCPKDTLVPLLGYNNKVIKSNVILHMEVIERAVHLLMLCYNYEKRQPQKRKSRGPNEGVSTTSMAIRPVAVRDPCPLCIENEMVNDVIDTLQKVMTRDEVNEHLKLRLELQDADVLMHNVSACQLPKSREIIQKRYQ